MPNIVIPAELIPSDGRFGAGPSKIRPQHLDALAHTGAALMGTSHRAAPVKQLVERIQRRVAELLTLPDGYEVVLGVGGASTFWDAAAASLIEHRSQHLVHGEFSGKFAREASAPWLETPDLVRAEPGSLGRPRPTAGIDVYAWPHNETSTGVQAPVQRVQGDAGALTVIDATSAAGGIMVDPEQFDAYYFSPQKNLASDGGLWLAALSPAAIERVARIATTNRFIPAVLSLQTAIENSRKHQTLNTPAIATLFLLDQQLGWLLNHGGLAWADARTKECSALLYRWAEDDSRLTPFVSDPAIRSQVVTTIDVDPSIDAASVVSTLRDNGILDVGGYRKLKRNQLRVSTFVSIEPTDIEQLIRSITFVLDQLD